MTALNSVDTILLLEALAVLLVVVIWLLIKLSKIKASYFSIAEAWVDNFKQSETDRVRQIDAMLGNIDVDPEIKNRLFFEIVDQEHALYRLIIRIFLNRDPKLLHDLQSEVNALARPYCKLLQTDSKLTAAPVIDNSALDLAEQEITRLTDENMILLDQLQQAIKTADTITEEYSRVFNGSLDEAELRKSAQRMLSIYQSGINSVKLNRTADSEYLELKS